MSLKWQVSIDYTLMELNLKKKKNTALNLTIKYLFIFQNIYHVNANLHMVMQSYTIICRHTSAPL